MSAVVAIQSIILSEVHPEWFKGIEPSLIEVARDKKQGRRWMSDYLSDHFEVFTVPDCEWLSVASCKPDSQLFFGGADWDELALFLGACTQVQTLRKIISGEKARTVIGHLDRKLSLKLMQFATRFPDKCRNLKGNEFLPVELWTRQLVSQGANELYWYARHFHPYLAERIRAYFPYEMIRAKGVTRPKVAPEVNPGLLDADMMKFCLAGYGREDLNQTEAG